MPHSLDCLILGGGIAGLWTLRTLLAEGYDAALVETNALGSRQTIASQGILHAGTKYALTGHAAQASKAASEAAAIWRDCLQSPSEPRTSVRGPALPDLSTTKILSPHTHLFTTPGLPSRLTALAASKALAIGPKKLSPPNRPPPFTAAPPGVDLYQLDEPVLDIPSLLETLAVPVRDRLIHANDVELSWDRLPAGASPSEKCPNRTRKTIAIITTDSGTLALHPRVLICTAGSGNEALLAQLGLAADIPMQRRPLHMTVARFSEPGVSVSPLPPRPTGGGESGGLPLLYAHCISLSDKPRATITTPIDALGRRVWLIGGQLAETGTARSPHDQIAATKAELTKILPWLDLSRLEFTTFRIDRAEGAHPDSRRPDTPVVRCEESVIACWPTKLVLAPLATAEIFTHLRALGITPLPSKDPEASPPALPFAHLPFAISPPGLATPPWDREDTPWT